MFTASVDTSAVQNADLFRNDLADLSKNRPSGEYPFWTRARVKKRVRPHFWRIVRFSKNVPCFSPGFDGFDCFDKTRK